MSSMTDSQRAPRGDHEIEHGELLARHDPEAAWGWDTPAGRLRAKRRTSLILDGAQVRPGMRVLEVGCGTDNFTEMFAKRGVEILAVDISPALLERARARGLPSERVQFECKRFEECEQDGPFDAAIGSSILHHLDIEPALNNIRRMLKPDGFLSFAEPNMLNPQVFAERKFRFVRRLAPDPRQEGNNVVLGQRTTDGWVAHGFSRGGHESAQYSRTPPLKRWATRPDRP
ncbi:MAG: class I SAM-dependent methyltransferase [Planctomycetota bacterium]